MEARHYQPTPVNTDDVVLSPGLLALAERLARNTHDVWAEGRIRQGWSYGPVRDDVRKTTPCLVPYEDLPEEEKVYDRDTSLETIRLLIKLGYRITGPSDPGP